MRRGAGTGEREGEDRARELEAAALLRQCEELQRESEVVENKRCQRRRESANSLHQTTLKVCREIRQVCYAIYLMFFSTHTHTNTRARARAHTHSHIHTHTIEHAHLITRTHTHLKTHT